jgi:DNA-directed RNA polymerase subunit F
MIGKELTGQRDVTLVEVKNILEKRKREVDKELSYEQKVTYEYAKGFSNLPVTKAKKLVEDLMKAVEKLDENSAVMIANLLPETKEDLMIIIEKKRFSLSDDETKKIINLVKKAK